MHVKNIKNCYAEQLGDLLDKCPKSIVAAIAVSALTMGGDCLDDAASKFLSEWRALHQNGIVHKAPPRHAIAERV